MTTTVSARASFVIYKDEPVSVPQTKSTPPSPSTQTIRLPTAGDKENLHPITGVRPLSEQPLSKKRKTGVLATKLIVSKSKTSKGDKEAPPSPKKRKLSRTSSKSSDGEEQGKKEKRAVPSKRRKGPASNRTRKVPELPPVHEETDEEREVEELLLKHKDVAQAVVDAKCYELTVLPLADVSKAYEDSTSLITESETTAEAKKSEKDEEPKGASQSSACPEHSIIQNTASPHSSEKKTAVFSTPERKRIYSAFTFSSPFAASEQLFVSQASSVDRFSDLDYDPVLDRAS